jgi:general secretion pathway protein E
MAEPYLDIHTADGRTLRRPLGDKPLTIGRHPDNALTIAEDTASRFHCVIEKIAGGYRVRDLKSRNGTKLNDQKIDAARLNPGDTLAIGKTTFRLMDADAAEAPARAKPPVAKPAATKPAATKPAPARAAKRDDDAPIPLEADELLTGGSSSDDEPDRSIVLEPVEDGDDAGPVSSEASMATLRKLATQGEGSALTEQDIVLLNSRGETVHAALGKDGDEARESQEGVRIMRLLLLSCARTRATDLHVEPKASDYTVRLRIDGTMVEAMHLDRKTAHRLVGVTKILSDIDISQRAIVQEGHFSVQLSGRRIDYRVSFTPSVHGQKLVIRVLDLANAPRFLTELKMPEWMAIQIKRVSRQDAGMILVTGPTGSGKTTTLYTVLRDIDVSQRNVVTIEDPVEYQLPGVTQIPVDAQKGNNFAQLLRSILRQDPDVILLGEVRDKETAMTAMQAAMTGHLVLSTVHAKDTIGTIFRLLDLGIEPYLVASALNLVVAQRLVRVLCPHCKVEKKPTPQQQMRMGRALEGMSHIFIPAGCPRCMGTGYAGRRAIFELLQVNDEIRDIILKSPTITAIRDTLKMEVFTTLQQNGYKLVAEGIASMDEIERVTGTE